MRSRLLRCWVLGLATGAVLATAAGLVTWRLVLAAGSVRDTFAALAAVLAGVLVGGVVAAVVWTVVAVLLVVRFVPAGRRVRTGVLAIGGVLVPVVVLLLIARAVDLLDKTGTWPALALVVVFAVVPPWMVLSTGRSTGT